MREPPDPPPAARPERIRGRGFVASALWLFIWMLVLLWVVPGDQFESEDPVEYVHEEQGFDTTEDVSGKMIITPDITTIFAC